MDGYCTGVREQTYSVLSPYKETQLPPNYPKIPYIKSLADRTEQSRANPHDKQPFNLTFIAMIVERRCTLKCDCGVIRCEIALFIVVLQSVRESEFRSKTSRGLLRAQVDEGNVNFHHLPPSIDQLFSALSSPQLEIFAASLAG